METEKNIEFDVDNSKRVFELRKQYSKFIYKNYDVSEDEKNIYIKFCFEIEGLKQFNPELQIAKKDYIRREIKSASKNTIEIQPKINNKSELEIDCKIKQLVFNIGMVEMISYWKATLSPQIIVECGSLSIEQIKFWKKLIYNGLSELRYRNNIDISFDNFVEITVNYNEKLANNDAETYMNNEEFQGYIIPVGGGKDSVVTLENLPIDMKRDYCFIINPREVTLECCKARGFQEDHIIEIQRKIDKGILELNAQGYINGHTPFSAMLSFVAYFVAYMTNKKYIALSNEASANEQNLTNAGEDMMVNHQYSKTYEYENDFRKYVGENFKLPIEYFSFLRPLNELQIAKLFAREEKYHTIFKSCNVGSKNKPWQWCGNCAKCLFVYTMLSPFIEEEKLIKVFGKNLFEDENLLTIFKQLTGYEKIKPFDCVGTFEEVKTAVTMTIKKRNANDLPYLLKYYNENCELMDLSNDITKQFNEENNLHDGLEKILKEVI